MFLKFRKLFNLITNLDLVRCKGMHTDAQAMRVLLKRFRIDCVIDVGANEGQFVARIREQGFKGSIFSFEPVTLAFNKLSDVMAKDKKWIGKKLAMGAAQGKAEINVSQHTSFSSILETTEFAKENWDSARTVAKESIDVSTLDLQLLEGTFGSCKSVLLKIDTQGYDLEVMKGAGDLIKKCVVIYCEVSFRAVYLGSPSYDQVFEFFAEKGFFPAAIYPITRTSDLALNEVDVFFVRRSENKN